MNPVEVKSYSERIAENEQAVALNAEVGKLQTERDEILDQIDNAETDLRAEL